MMDSPDIINLGAGLDISIKELATLIAETVGYHGEIFWDPSKPDGMLRKCLDTSKLTNMGFTPHAPHVTLEAGIQQTVSEYRQLKQETKA